MSEFAAINALRKSERDLTSKNKRLEDELAAAQRDHANARAWILQMQTERKELLTAAQDVYDYTFKVPGKHPGKFLKREVVFRNLKAAIDNANGVPQMDAAELAERREKASEPTELPYGYIDDEVRS